MTIGYHPDLDDYNYSEIARLEDENKRLREVIRNTYLTVDRIADDKLLIADRLSNDDNASTADQLESVDTRGRAIGNKEANIQLMRFLIQFGFDHDMSLIR